MSPLDPSASALMRAGRRLGSRSPALVVRKLAGGSHASTHVVRAVGARREAVLRRFPLGDEAAVARETRVLTALDGLGGMAPVLLAADPSGRHAGVPTVLLSRLRGGPDITPSKPVEWAAALGRALAVVHAVPLDGLSGFQDVMERETTALARASGPETEPLTRAWRRLVGAPRVLTHFDYWSGNVVWDSGVLSGVVDWSDASLAPRGFDLGWCRLDLALLYGGFIADVFLAAYERASGVTVPDMTLWDLHATLRSRHDVETWLPNYHDLGRTDFRPSDLRRGHTAWRDARLSALSVPDKRGDPDPT